MPDTLDREFAPPAVAPITDPTVAVLAILREQLAVIDRLLEMRSDFLS